MYGNNKKNKINIEIKKAKPVYLDEEGFIYDKKSIELSNPIQIARIKNGKLIKV